MIFGPRKPSIKEALDNLPAGILFYRASGLVTLCNHAMNTIAEALLGEPLQDGAAFWRAVCEQGEAMGNDTYLLLAGDQSWLMSNTQSIFEGLPLWEAHAKNVTEQVQLTRQLAEENARIVAVSESLRRYNDDVLELTAQRELLERKAHIHDELGRLLSETRYLLAGGAVNEEALWSQWQLNAELMLAEARRPDEDLLASLHQAASDVGVRLQVDGRMPQDPLATDLLFAIVGESLTNLLRHAGGDALRIGIQEAGDEYLIEVSNNGRAPEGPVAEGGGLSALRRKAEAIGGSMRVSAAPAFLLKFEVPRRSDDAPDVDRGGRPHLVP